MYTFFVVLIVIAAILMIGIVLIQESKGGGLASNFQSSNQVLGVRKTTDVIEKTTWGLAIAMVLLSIACAYTAPKAVSEQSILEQKATPQQQTTAPTNTQGFGSSEQKQQAAPATQAKPEANAPATGAQQAPAEQQAAQTPAQPAKK